MFTTTILIIINQSNQEKPQDTKRVLLQKLKEI